MKREAQEAFFEYARLRHNIYLKRRSGEPGPWTDDRVLLRHRFTNIHRELDRTTIWFRKNIRGPLRHSEWVVPATVIFRWFNRITTGEILLHPAVGIMEGRFDTKVFEQLMRSSYPKGPWVTGSYLVFSGKNNGDKLTGLLNFIARFLDWWSSEGRSLFFSGAERLRLQQANLALQSVDGLAGFTAYEVVTDLRWTDAVKTTDRNQWCHVGPGAMRGVSRMMGWPYGSPDAMHQENVHHQQLARVQMKKLLRMANSGAENVWPQHGDWPRWEMREVEHTLCEFDKYERVRREQGQTKMMFRWEGARPLLDQEKN